MRPASLFFGYRLAEISPGQRAFVAAPEKAMLDLVHLPAGGDDPAFLAELRLQNLERLDMTALSELVRQAASPKPRRAAAWRNRHAARSVMNAASVPATLTNRRHGDSAASLSLHICSTIANMQEG